MKKSLAMALCFMGFASTVAQAAPIEIEIQQWKPALSSNIKYNGTDFSVKNTLGMQDKNIPNVAVKWDAGNNHWNVRYLSVNYHGLSTPSTPFTFQDKTYDITQTISSDLKVKMVDISKEHVISRGQNSQLSLVYDLKVLKNEAILDADQNPQYSRKRNITLPFPGLGVVYQKTISDNLNYHAKVVGLPLLKYGHVYDADMGITIKPDKNLNVLLGYRFFDVKGQRNDNHYDLSLKGAYFAIESKF